MEDDWEKIAEQPNIVIPPKPPNINKWEGEDEEEEVKENWEDDEEKKDEEKTEIKMVKAKPKKSLQEKIAEKEKLKQLELEKKLEEENEDDLSPEDRIAEKLRLQKLQEEEDFKVAMDTFGVTGEKVTGIDGMYPTTKAEFTELSDAINRKVTQFKLKDEFPAFIEELIRNLSANLNAFDMKKIKTTVDNLCLEKQRLEKEKTKPKGKAKKKAILRVEGDNTNLEEGYGYGEFEYDDFM